MRISDWSSDVCSSDLAVAEGVQGKAVTPFLLARLEGLTGGASLDANVALVLNNARLAAEIATAYAALQAALPPSPSALSRGRGQLMERQPRMRGVKIRKAAWRVRGWPDG